MIKRKMIEINKKKVLESENDERETNDLKGLMNAHGQRGCGVGWDAIVLNAIISRQNRKSFLGTKKPDQRSSVTRHGFVWFPFSLFCLTLFSVLFWSLEFVFVLFVDEDGG